MDKIKFKYYAAAIFLLFFALPIQAQSPPVHEQIIFKLIKIEDGLSQSSVYCMLQDRKGFLWFGTANGLNRYDGYTFKIYSNNPMDSTTISDNGALALFEDKNGYIWIGTSEGILNRFDRRTGIFKRYYLTGPLTITDNTDEKYYDFPIPFSRNSDNTITSIAEGPDNTIWIGTWGKGLIRFNPKNNSVVHYHHQPDKKNGLASNRVKTICSDGEDVWVGTLGGGLYRLTARDNFSEFTKYISDPKNINSISDDRIISLFNDTAGNLWIGTYGGGLDELKQDQKEKPGGETKFIRYFNKPGSNSLSNDIVTSLIQDSRGTLWIGTYGGGLDIFDPASETFFNFHNDPKISTSLSKNDILSLMEDASGTLWIGTHLGKGINKVESNVEKFNHVSRGNTTGTGLDDDVVWAIEQDKDSVIWIGTYKGGLNKWDRTTGKFTYYKNQPGNINSISDNHIRALQTDNAGNLWIGTYNSGLNLFDKSTKSFRRFRYNPEDSTSLGADQIQTLYIDKKNNFWVGTFGGGLNLMTINPEDGRIHFKRYVHDSDDPFSISDNRVYCIYEDHDGMMWVGTFGGGLNKFDRSNNRFVSYKKIPGDITSLSDNRIMTMFEDNKGNFWVGTYGGGLHRFDKRTEKFTRYDERNKPNSSVVYGILEDKNDNLWMSTDNGLFKFNIQSENFTRYDLHDGLQSLEFSGGAFLKTKNGEMFFGGINGFNYFYPENIKDNYFIPPIVLSSVRILNELYRGERDTLYLSYDQNFLSLEFSALDYTNPTDNLYAYKLEGFDDNWHYVDSRNRIANYTNLSPGEYIFKVRGSNNDGIWNNVGAEFHLIIAPPFWKTWWFISIMVFLTGTVIYYLSTVRYRNLLAIEKIKTKLSADLHDNVGSGLTEISILSELASQQIETASPDSSKQLNVISEKARTLIDNMSDIVWMVNPHRDSLYHLILRLKDSYSDIMYALGISFAAVNIERFSDVKLPMDYKQNLYLIFKEGINNAIKHSRCKKITLETNHSKDNLEIILRDDGIGIDPEIVKYGNGILNMQNRAKLIGAKLIVDASNGGTLIKFTGKISGLNKLFSFRN